MKRTSLLKSFGLCVALTSVAMADPLSWSSEISGYPLKFLKDYGSASDFYYAGNFDLTANGFNSSTMTIQSATASFAFADDSPNDGYGNETDSSEYVDVLLHTFTLMDDQEVDGAHPSSSYAWYSASLNATMLASLQDDGQISFKVQLQNTYGTNDVYLKVAKLVAVGVENPTTSVPDAGATSTLLGLALAGLIALRKRFGQIA